MQMPHNTVRLWLLRVMTEPIDQILIYLFFCSRCTCYRVVTMKSTVRF